MWNFKSALWNFTQNFESTPQNMLFIRCWKFDDLWYLKSYDILSLSETGPCPLEIIHLYWCTAITDIKIISRKSCQNNGCWCPGWLLHRSPASMVINRMPSQVQIQELYLHIGHGPIKAKCTQRLTLIIFTCKFTNVKQHWGFSQHCWKDWLSASGHYRDWLTWSPPMSQDTCGPFY